MWVETQPSVQYSSQTLNVDNSYPKAEKTRYYIFEVLFNFTVFLYFVENILSSIADLNVFFNRHQVSLCFSHL